MRGDHRETDSQKEPANVNLEQFQVSPQRYLRVPAVRDVCCKINSTGFAQFGFLQGGAQASKKDDYRNPSPEEAELETKPWYIISIRGRWPAFISHR